MGGFSFGKILKKKVRPRIVLSKGPLIFIFYKNLVITKINNTPITVISTVFMEEFLL
jgi:hypothetical protein